MLEIQKKYKIKFKNKVQTNGSLINNEFADFFKRNNFVIGLSIDGPKNINDLTRFDKRNNSTFSNVMDNIKILKNYNIQFGVIATISKYNVKHPKEIYDFFKENNLSFQFNPIFYSGNAKENFNFLAISPEEYTNFLIELGETWLDDPNPITISVFDEIFGFILNNGNYDQLCCFSRDCHKNFLAIGPTGELYPCCLFQGYNTFSYGNILSISLKDISNTFAWEIMNHRKESIDTKCSNCSIYKYCYGGCPFIAYIGQGTINDRDYYCNSYKKFIINMMNNIKRKIKNLEKGKL